MFSSYDMACVEALSQLLEPRYEWNSFYTSLWVFCQAFGVRRA